MHVALVMDIVNTVLFILEKHVLSMTAMYYNVINTNQGSYVYKDGLFVMRVLKIHPSVI
jgi:hypothetical protein